jgi:hypothetical protein
MPGFGKQRLPQGFIDMFYKTIEMVNARLSGVARAVEHKMKLYWINIINHQHEKMCTSIIIRQDTIDDAAEIVWDDNQRVHYNMAYAGTVRAMPEKHDWIVSVLFYMSYGVRKHMGNGTFLTEFIQRWDGWSVRWKKNTRKTWVGKVAGSTP